MAQKELVSTPEYEALPRTGYAKHYWRHTCHKWHVFRYCVMFAIRIVWRGFIHDYSKYLPSEAKGFAQSRDTTGYPYGHDYCRLSGKEIKETIYLHKSRNPHHPEFHKNGVNDMDLVTFVEMACDWAAARRKNSDGSFVNSVDQNQTRYGLQNQTKDILKNTKMFS